MLLLMSLRFGLGLLMLVCCTASVVAAEWTLPPYIGCPPTTLDGCECSESNLLPTVTVTGTNDAMDSCMTHLSESGHTMVAQLNVVGGENLNLTPDILQDVLIKELYFDDVAIVEVDENFLGNSGPVTSSLKFRDCSLEMGIPKVNGDALTGLRYFYSNLGTHIHLSKTTFSGTPALEVLGIYSSFDTPSLSLARNVFRNLTQLRLVDIVHSVSLKWGSLHFTSPQLEGIDLGGGKSYTLDIGPGSFSGVPATAWLYLDGTVTDGWQPSKFFNLLRSGVHISSFYGVDYDCDCDMAWIRYSSFIDQVEIDCQEGRLSNQDLSHCPFYKNRNKTEL